MVQYTIRSKIAKWVVWINFGLTVVATLYFGWHYVADDLAGIVIALVELLRRGHRERPEVRPKAHDLPPDHDDLGDTGESGSRTTSVCFASRHADG